MSGPAHLTAVWLAFRKYLAAQITHDIAWPENDRFVPGAGPFVAVQFLPAPPQRLTLGEGQVYRQSGQLLLTVMFPPKYTFGQMLGDAEALALKFPDSLRLSYGQFCVSVTATARPGMLYRDGNGRAGIPINVQWESTAR